MIRYLQALVFLIFFSFLLILIKCTDSSTPTLSSWPKENNCVIAHAGGKIGNHIYTNSLESLYQNYEKGCRLFELDIQETSDGKLVAVHDWKEFRQITNRDRSEINYQPLTEEQVLRSKIFGLYTPLNMMMINKWFKEHPDAILVTDKISDPKRFVNPKDGFIYKERLIMEIFSWEAADRAINSGVTPMISQNVLFSFEKETNRILRYLKKKEIEFQLKKMRVKFLCFSYKKINEHNKFVKNLKNEGFLSYVYHLNYDKKIDEKYVFENYLDYVHGIYADDIDIISYMKNHQ